MPAEFSKTLSTAASTYIKQLRLGRTVSSSSQALVKQPMVGDGLHLSGEVVARWGDAIGNPSSSALLGQVNHHARAALADGARVDVVIRGRIYRERLLAIRDLVTGQPDAASREIATLAKYVNKVDVERSYCQNKDMGQRLEAIVKLVDGVPPVDIIHDVAVKAPSVLVGAEGLEGPYALRARASMIADLTAATTNPTLRKVNELVTPLAGRAFPSVSTAAYTNAFKSIAAITEAP